MYIRIDGKVSQKQRYESINVFQSNPQIKVAILSITAAGIGLTLTAASIVVFVEMHFTPAIMVQAEDRAHRIGQMKSVNCYYLFAEKTMDKQIYSQLQQKFQVVTGILDGTAVSLHESEKKKIEVEERDKHQSQKQAVENKNNTKLSDFFICKKRCLNQNQGLNNINNKP